MEFGFYARSVGLWDITPDVGVINGHMRNYIHLYVHNLVEQFKSSASAAVFLIHIPSTSDALESKAVD
jgi:hypothetical protein